MVFRSLAEPPLAARRNPRLSFVLRFVMPALGVFSLAALLVGISVGQIAQRANEIDDERSTQAVSAAFRAMQTQMAAMVRDNAYWDDAASEVDKNDARWIDATWGVATGEGGFYSHSFVLDADAAPLYAYKNGDPIGTDVAKYLNPEVTEFAKTVIGAGPGANSARAAFFQFERGIAVIGAAVLTPVSQSSVVVPNNVHLLVLVRKLNDTQIKLLADSYVIPNLRVATDVKVYGPSVKLVDFVGRPVARLTWDPQRPGEKSEESIRPVVIEAIVLLGAALVFLLVFYWRSVSKLRQREQAARHFAVHDALSGLSNRLGLMDCLAAALQSRSSDQVALLYLDLDGFKEINDSYGHATGDELIKAVAGDLRELAPGSSHVARVGGDEFAIVLKDGRSKWVRDVFIPSVLRRFGKPVTIGGRICVVGASLGLSYSETEVDAAELLRRADVAMYFAKQDGGNRLSIYEPGLEADRIERQGLEDDLRRAVESDSLEVAYQPIVDATTQRISGVEALARWNRPGFGSVSPDVFIPAAESSGLIDVLGLQVLRKASEQAMQWPWLQLSVNVSPGQFRNPDFPNVVGHLLNEVGIDPRRITIEITEGYLIRHADRAIRAIKKLRAMGLKIALDDFGSGFASIGYLKQFDFDRLKIDRSLVVALGENGSAAEILQATMAFARALDLPVTAEGIETDDQLSVLRLAGSDSLQGYLFGRPMSAAQLSELVMPAAQAERVAV